MIGVGSHGDPLDLGEDEVETFIAKLRNCLREARGEDAAQPCRPQAAGCLCRLLSREKVNMEHIVWGIVPASILVAGLHLARVGRSATWTLGALACICGFVLGPQCLCKNVSDRLIGDLSYASLSGLVLFASVLLLRAVALALRRLTTG